MNKMEIEQYKFKMISYKSDDYQNALQLRIQQSGKEVSHMMSALERNYIHLACKKGSKILAIAVLKPIEMKCEIIHMCFENEVHGNSVIAEQMFHLCKRIAWLYGFDELFFKQGENRVLVNLNLGLIGNTAKKYNSLNERLQEILTYILNNKNSLADYEIDYFLEMYESLFNVVKNEFVRGSLTALYIRYEFEHRERIAIQNATKGDLLNIVNDIELENINHILQSIEAIIHKNLQLKDLDTFNISYSSAVRIAQLANEGLKIIELLKYKEVYCIQEQKILEKYCVLCTIFDKAYNLSKCLKLTEISLQSKDIIQSGEKLLYDSIDLYEREMYFDALKQVNNISLEFVASETIKNANSIASVNMISGRWTKQIQNE